MFYYIIILHYPLQDQFVLQMVSLMDSLLKRESLDLKLTPYKVHHLSMHWMCGRAEPPPFASKHMHGGDNFPYRLLLLSIIWVIIKYHMEAVYGGECIFLVVPGTCSVSPLVNL
jgi:hypothetical protein